jgi:hypothetical protein
MSFKVLFANTAHSRATVWKMKYDSEKKRFFKIKIHYTKLQIPRSRDEMQNVRNRHIRLNSLSFLSWHHSRMTYAIKAVVRKECGPLPCFLCPSNPWGKGNSHHHHHLISATFRLVLSHTQSHWQKRLTLDFAQRRNFKKHDVSEAGRPPSSGKEARSLVDPLDELFSVTGRRTESRTRRLCQWVIQHRRSPVVFKAIHVCI